jgi:hypothetical protein
MIWPSPFCFVGTEKSFLPRDALLGQGINRNAIRGSAFGLCPPQAGVSTHARISVRYLNDATRHVHYDYVAISGEQWKLPARQAAKL